MKINLKDVDLIEALDDYIKIYTKPSPVLTLMTLKGILEKLPPRDFIRVHRSYIIPISKIDRFSKSKIWVGEKEMIFCGKAKSFVNEYGDKVVAPAFSKGKYTFTARFTVVKPKLVTTPSKEIVFTVK